VSLRAAPPGRPGPATSFALPPCGEATAPPERRGVPRDGVRLLVAQPDGVAHRRFRDLPGLLEPGDLLVVNTSATLPAALDARREDGAIAPVHVSTQLDDGDWVVEVRAGDGSGPDLGVETGETLGLEGGVRLRLREPFPDPSAPVARLWRASATPPLTTGAYLPRHGRPIGYRYLADRYPLSDHQTVFATHPGSAEMASAGRPFTDRLVVELVTRGIAVAPLVLHAGVSSPELHEPPSPERYVVPEATARLVNGTRGAGRRAVAVGTTVVRALETVARTDGCVRDGSGWTDLVLEPERPARAITGLVTGLHPSEASHLLLLEAVAGADLVGAAYASATARNYLWHEFGDSMLFLP
jgi:S-adenosylmethionine:tRNA ribosyltransferase-isomerase